MTAILSPGTLLDFELPARLEASAPPEVRGSGRGDVRLLVARRTSARIEHRRFEDLPDLLRPGDLLVVNTSATVAAAVAGRVAGAPALLHLSGRVRGDQLVELRRPDPGGRGSSPWLEAEEGAVVELPDGGAAELLRPALPRLGAAGVRLWAARLSLPTFVEAYLGLHGRPIRYGHVDREWPLAAYQTIFSLEAGSAEMPSAARPFTSELVTRLVAGGVGVVPVLLHCGVSSPEAGEPPQSEYYRVPATTAAAVNAARRAGRWIVAVGTTSVRALESAAGAGGELAAAEGWTDLVIGPERGLRTVDALITGWHEPRSSHLGMLEAVGGRSLLEASYQAALENRYLWHEFGDSHLILP
ncbi:MAG: queuosine biosynthesis protein [Candidatus Nephthysia bennettiae]|nr:MAG: queuosine biosynthesis protein [Candidatus Dormibacteraeota bacterium]